MVAVYYGKINKNVKNFSHDILWLFWFSFKPNIFFRRKLIHEVFCYSF